MFSDKGHRFNNGVFRHLWLLELPMTDVHLNLGGISLKPDHAPTFEAAKFSECIGYILLEIST